MAAVTEVNGKKFIQLTFATASSDTFKMSADANIKSVRLTAPPGYLADADFVTFKEVYNSEPSIFTLSNEAKATFFQQPIFTKLGIVAYKLTYYANVVLSIELG